jgi:molecular chaperone DnaK
MRRQGDVREIRSTRFDPRAEPDDDAPPPPPSEVRPATGPELPPTKPRMHAVREPAEDDALMTLSGRTARLEWGDQEPPPPSALPGTSRAREKPPVPSAPESARSRGGAQPGVVELPSDDLKPDELDPSASLLIDVTPLSLRVETVGGYSDVLIAANSRVPCDRTRIFSTASDGQTHVFIRVAQGESRTFVENTFLGELELAGIEPLARGEAQLAVTFEIDADGILAVRAKDTRTGKEAAARMHVFGAQTEEGDLQKMLRRQREHAVV